MPLVLLVLLAGGLGQVRLAGGARQLASAPSTALLADAVPLRPVAATPPQLLTASPGVAVELTGRQALTVSAQGRAGSVLGVQNN